MFDYLPLSFGWTRYSFVLDSLYFDYYIYQYRFILCVQADWEGFRGISKSVLRIPLLNGLQVVTSLSTVFMVNLPQAATNWQPASSTTFWGYPSIDIHKSTAALAAFCEFVLVPCWMHYSNRSQRLVGWPEIALLPCTWYISQSGGSRYPQGVGRHYAVVTMTTINCGIVRLAGTITPSCVPRTPGGHAGAVVAATTSC